MTQQSNLDPEEAKRAQEAKNAKIIGILLAVFLVLTIGAMMAIDMYQEQRLQMMGLHHEGPADAAEK